MWVICEASLRILGYFVPFSFALIIFWDGRDVKDEKDETEI
jgi:hypothetical protein